MKKTSLKMLKIADVECFGVFGAFLYFYCVHMPRRQLDITQKTLLSSWIGVFSLLCSQMAHKLDDFFRPELMTSEKTIRFLVSTIILKSLFFFLSKKKEAVFFHYTDEKASIQKNRSFEHKNTIINTRK